MNDKPFIADDELISNLCVFIMKNGKHYIGYMHVNDYVYGIEVGETETKRATFSLVGNISDVAKWHYLTQKMWLSGTV